MVEALSNMATNPVRVMYLHRKLSGNRSYRHPSYYEKSIEDFLKETKCNQTLFYLKFHENMDAGLNILRLSMTERFIRYLPLDKWMSLVTKFSQYD